MKKLILSFMTCILLFGCNIAGKVGETVLNATVIGADIKSGRVFQIVNSVEHTDVDRTKIQHADMRVQQFINKWKSVAANIDDQIPDDLFNQFISEYQIQVVSSYQIVDGIVETKWDEYTPMNQTYLRQYNEQALIVHNSVNELIEFRAKKNALFTALRFAEIVAGMTAGVR